MKIKVIAFLFFSFVILFTLEGSKSFAFSINNNSDIIVNVKQYSGGSFKSKILPGDKKSCNWKNKSCNNQGKRDSIVKLSVERYMENLNYWIIAKSPKKNKFTKNNICNIEMKADALLIIDGHNGNYKCVVYGN